jgi:hypothetical protein
LTYSDTFLFQGTIEFRYRANTKIIGGKMANGIFKFTIDGVDQNVVSDHLMSNLWIPIERDVTPGFHIMEWRFSKYNNLVE